MGRAASARQFQVRAGSQWSPAGHPARATGTQQTRRSPNTVPQPLRGRTDRGRGYGEAGYRRLASAEIFRSIWRETREPRQPHAPLSLICFCRVCAFCAFCAFFYPRRGSIRKRWAPDLPATRHRVVSLSEQMETSRRQRKTYLGRSALTSGSGDQCRKAILMILLAQSCTLLYGSSWYSALNGTKSDPNFCCPARKETYLAPVIMPKLES